METPGKAIRVTLNGLKPATVERINPPKDWAKKMGVPEMWENMQGS